MFEHTKTLLTLVERFQQANHGPLAMAEVGVCHGTTSGDLLRECPTLRMYLVDNYQPYMRFSFDRQLGHLKRAMTNTQPYCDRRSFLIMDSMQAADLLPDGSLDLVFIDGDHTYEPVQRDLAAWWPKLKADQQSIFCGHDYSKQFPGVIRAVDEWAAQSRQPVSLLPNTIWWTVKQ